LIWIAFGLGLGLLVALQLFIVGGGVLLSSLYGLGVGLGVGLVGGVESVSVGNRSQLVGMLLSED